MTVGVYFSPCLDPCELGYVLRFFARPEHAQGLSEDTVIVQDDKPVESGFVTGLSSLDELCFRRGIHASGQRLDRNQLGSPQMLDGQ